MTFDFTTVKFRRVANRLCVQRQMLDEEGFLKVKKNLPVWEYVPVWKVGEEFAGCECKGGEPADRCTLKWLRCGGRIAEQYRRVGALLSYQDPDKK